MTPEEELTKMSKEVDELLEILDKLKNPELFKCAEELHKRMSYLSPEDRMRKYD